MTYSFLLTFRKWSTWGYCLDEAIQLDPDGCVLRMTYEMFAVEFSEDVFCGDRQPPISWVRNYGKEVNALFVDSRLVIGMKLPPKILTLKVCFEIQVNYVEKINAVLMGLVILCT